MPNGNKQTGNGQGDEDDSTAEQEQLQRHWDEIRRRQQEDQD